MRLRPGAGKHKSTCVEVFAEQLSAHMRTLGARGGKVSGAKRMEMPGAKRKAISLISATSVIRPEHRGHARTGRLLLPCSLDHLPGGHRARGHLGARQHDAVRQDDVGPNRHSVPDNATSQYS